MRIWWCEEHRAASAPDDDHELCEVAGMVNFLEALALEGPCRFVEMELTPVGSGPAPYDIEIPDFVNRNSMGW